MSLLAISRLMVRGECRYEAQYCLNITARPLIAKAQIDIAREFGATARMEPPEKETTSADSN